MSTRQQGARRKAAAAPAPSAFEQAVTAAGLTSKPGKGAVKEARYSGLIEGKLATTRFTASVDIDTAFERTEGTANRWDYGLGVRATGQPECAVWVEPHSAASTGEVNTMLAKLVWLKGKLAQPEFTQLKALTDACVAQGRRPYHWLASANVAIRPGSREAHMLAARGMDLPKSKVVI